MRIFSKLLILLLLTSHQCTLPLQLEQIKLKPKHIAFGLAAGATITAAGYMWWKSKKPRTEIDEVEAALSQLPERMNEFDKKGFSHFQQFIIKNQHKEGYEQALQRLIERGADINVISQDGFSAISIHPNPLSDGVRRLILAKADANKRVRFKFRRVEGLCQIRLNEYEVDNMTLLEAVAHQLLNPDNPDSRANVVPKPQEAVSFCCNLTDSEARKFCDEQNYTRAQRVGNLAIILHRTNAEIIDQVKKTIQHNTASSKRRADDEELLRQILTHDPIR